MNNQALLLVLLASSFFIFGYLLTLIIKKKNNLVDIAIGMSFSVLALLAIFELNSEAMENFNFYYGNRLISLALLIGSMAIGMGVLKLIDKFVPHHNHFEEKETHHHHLYHIGLMTFISLVLHNLVEGMAIYSLGSSDLNSGLMLAIAIGLHNLPFGMQIGTLMNNKLKTILLITGLILSTIIGGVLGGIVGSINVLLIGILVAITLGMVVYLLVFELLPEIKASKNKKNIYLGMIIGTIIMGVSLIL